MASFPVAGCWLDCLSGIFAMTGEGGFTVRKTDFFGAAPPVVAGGGIVKAFLELGTIESIVNEVA